MVCGLVDGNVKRYVDTQLRIFQRDLVRNQSRDSRAAMSEALANPGLAVNQLLKMKARGLITMEEFLELTAEAAGSHEDGGEANHPAGHPFAGVARHEGLVSAKP